MNIKVIITDINGLRPTRGSADAAGFDLYASSKASIAPQSRAIVKTGIVLEIPSEYYGRIAPRSGLALKHGIDVMAGVIDADYRGEIGVILYNTDKEKTFHVDIGDRIAQIIIEKYYNFDMVLASEISYTKRNDGGFGSSGK